ncbi:MAG: hypothetical protein HOC23_12375 [Halieaceae bacterium]|jgi:hypothetical protein|nr:hypothetical protein [Halieaceae bacterium]
MTATSYPGRMLLNIGFVGVLSLLGGCSSDSSQDLETALPEYLQGPSLYADVQVYDALGVHRTATPVDHETTQWMTGHLQTNGFSVVHKPFVVRQYFPEETRLQVGNLAIEAEPQWPVIPLSHPLEAILVPWREDGNNEALDGAIALVIFPYLPRSRISLPQYRQAVDGARLAGAKAIVAVTEGPSGEIITMNADLSVHEVGIPIVLVGGKDREKLEFAAMQGQTARLSLSGRVEESARGFSTLGKRERPGKWVIVSTPQSGWTHAAGERGPGIALWRALAKWAAEDDSDTSYLFLSNSGHEMGNKGMEEAFDDHGLIPPPEQVKLWIHLGAGIATYDAEQVPGGLKMTNKAYRNRYLVTSLKIWPHAARHFAGIPGLFPIPIIDGLIAGETEVIHARGYSPLMGFFGNNIYHHVMKDRADAITGPELLEDVATALFGFLGDVQ